MCVLISFLLSVFAELLICACIECISTAVQGQFCIKVVKYIHVSYWPGFFVIQTQTQTFTLKHVPYHIGLLAISMFNIDYADEAVRTPAAPFAAQYLRCVCMCVCV